MKLPHFEKPTKRQAVGMLKYCASIFLGNMIAAGSAAFFIIPNGLVMGGTTGVGIFLRNVMGSSISPAVQDWIVSITVYGLNIILFLIGAILLGKKFAAATLAGTLLYPSFISIFTPLNNLVMEKNGGPIAGDNVLLATLFGALLFGVGLAIVIRVGASTGGTDIPPLILHKFFGIPVSASMWILDVAIVLLQFFGDITIDTVLLGILICILSSVMIDVVSPIGQKKTQVKIISKKYREIRRMILDEIGRGVTMLYGKTGYLKEECYVLLTVVSNRDLVKLRNAVQNIDPEAFMTVSVVSEVRGRGFTSEGIRLPKDLEVKDETEPVSASEERAEEKSQS